MNRRHTQGYETNDESKPYFKQWEVIKLCPTRVKEYFDEKKNIFGRNGRTNRALLERKGGIQEKRVLGRLLLPPLENNKQKCGSFDDVATQKPVVLIEPILEKLLVGDSWKNNIKQYKIEGFLCVPSLYKYDPYEPDILRTTSDTCIRYRNYESQVPPEQRFWGLSKKNSSSPEIGIGSEMVGGQKCQFYYAKKHALELSPPIESSSVHGVQDSNYQKPELRKQAGGIRILKDEDHSLHNAVKSDDGFRNEGDVVPANGSSSCSIDDSLISRFTRPICETQKQQTSNKTNGKTLQVIEPDNSSSLHGIETKYTKTNSVIVKRDHSTLSHPKACTGRVNVNQRYMKHPSKTLVKENIQRDLRNAKTNTPKCKNSFHDERIPSKVEDLNGGSSQRTNAIIQINTNSESKYVKISDTKAKVVAKPSKKDLKIRQFNTNGLRTNSSRIKAFLSSLQNYKIGKFQGDISNDQGDPRQSSRNVTSSAGSASTQNEMQNVRTTENNANNTAECFAIKDTGNQHVSSMCGEWKPNLASLDASKLSRSIKTSSANEVTCAPNKNRFQYHCRRKQSENTGKTPLQVMNYCFEGRVATPVGAGEAASKPENRRLLSSDKVCSGRDGVKKKDRQYGSNFSVKASKSYFDLTTRVLLQARESRK